MDQELINDIKNKADIVKVISSYINLEKKGKDYVGKCPFHDDHNPSMSVSPELQLFNCWVCGTKGTVFNFVQYYEKISFIEAVKKVAELIGYHDDRLVFNTPTKKKDEKLEPLYACLDDLTNYYQFSLSSVEGEEGYNYLKSRNLSDDIIQKFKIGYAIKDGFKIVKFLHSKGHSLKTIEDIGIGSLRGEEYFDKNEGRVIFPLADKEGQVIGFSARRLNDDEDTSKYINTAETPVFHKSEVLYNYHNAKVSALSDKYVYVLEGFMDVIALAKAGINSAVAIMGTALTNEHIELLKKLKAEVRLCLDSDYAGQKNTFKAAKMLTAANIDFRIVDARGSLKDPDVILNNDGAEALKAYLNNLYSFNDFLFHYYSDVEPLKSNESKKTVIKAFIPFLLSLNSGFDVNDYIAKLSRLTGYEIATIKEFYLKNKKANSSNVEEVMSSFHPERKALKKLVMAESEILHQMIHNDMAIDFYQNTIKGFYDEIYRNLANYVIEAYQEHSSPNNVSKVLTLIDANEPANKNELKNELIQLEQAIHPNECNEKLLNEYYVTIVKEKERMVDNDKINMSFEGKSESEKARILHEYNKNRLKGLKK